MTEELLFEKRGEIGWVTFNRPKARNALTFAMYEGLAEICARVGKTREVRALMVTGGGDKAFAAGTDIAQFQSFESGEDGIAYELKMDRILGEIERCPVPTIAAINGPAIAGGFDLAVLCDLRVASRTARFAHPERAFGDVVYGPLHDLVGGALARELTMGGRSIDATEALACGLVGAVAEPSELLAATAELVARVCVAPRDVLVRLKAKALSRAGIAPGARTLEL